MLQKQTRHCEAGTPWDAREERVISWLATPPAKRAPKTQLELAAELELDPATLSRLKRRPGLLDAVQARIAECTRDRLPAILDAVGKQAERGDVQAAKFIWEATSRRPDILPLGPVQRRRQEAIMRELMGDYSGRPGVYGILVRRLAHLEVLLEDAEAGGARLSHFARLVDQLREVITQIQRHTESLKSEISVHARQEAMRDVIVIVERHIAPRAPGLWLETVRAIEAELDAPDALALASDQARD